MLDSRECKIFVNCLVCGRILMKCQGKCNLEITCGKCNSDIVAIVDKERVKVFENRRRSGQIEQVKVSVHPTKGCKQMQSMKRAANY